MPKPTAFADETFSHTSSTEHESDGWNELSEGGTLGDSESDDMVYYYLLDDVELEENITIVGNVTLCLNGHVLTGTGSGSVITVSSGANFTLCDCGGSETQTHYYTVSSSGLYTFCSECNHSESEHYSITGGVITGGATSTYDNYAGVLVYGGTFVMEGGTIAGNGNNSSIGGGVLVHSGTFVMEGGTITGNHSLTAGSMYVNSAVSVYINGGYISGNVYNAGTIEMTGGYLDGSVSNINSATFTITGGYLSSTAYNESYIEDGYKAIATGDSTWAYFVTSSAALTHTDSTSDNYSYIEASGENYTEATNTLTLSGGYYYLATDMTLNITISGTVTLCLNGYMLTGTGSGTVITVLSGASLTLCDCGGSETQTHYYTVSSSGLYTFCSECNHSESDHYSITGGVITGGSASGVYVNGGTFTMYGGTISGNSASLGGGVLVYYYSTFTMYGGEISGNYAFMVGGVSVYGTFIMKGGEISGNTASSNGDVNVQGDGSVYINDGYLSGSIENYGTIEMTGGYLDGSVSNINSATFTVTGGYLSSTAYNESYIEDGYKAIDNSDDTYIWRVVHYHSDEGGADIEFTGGTITENSTELSGNDDSNDPTYYNLNRDITLTEDLTISGGYVTICLNGHTLTGNIIIKEGASLTICDCDGDGKIVGDIEVEEAGTLEITGGTVEGTICNYGEMTITDGTVDGSITNTDSGTFEMSGGTIAGDITNGGTLEITGGTVDGTITNSGTIEMSGGTVEGTITNNGTFTMSGGYFNGSITNNSGTITITGGTVCNTSDESIKNTDSGTLKITGGYFDGSITNSDNGTISISGGYFSEEPDSSYMAGGYAAVETGDSTWKYAVVPSSEATHSCGDTNYNYVLTELGGTLQGGNEGSMVYYYLAEDITLTENITISGYVTLCLNGHILTGAGSGSVITVSENAYFVLCDCAGGGVITGGTGTTINESTYGGGVYVSSSATFVMEGGTIADNSADYGGGVYVNGGTFEMTSGEISGNSATNGGGVYVNGGTFEMTGGEISGNTADYGGGVYVTGSNATFTMTDGTISGNTATENGGGVYVYDYDAGTILNNVATYDVGVYVTGSNATFNMDGGTISGNTAGGNGHGVYVYGGAVYTMTDGYLGDSISDGSDFNAESAGTIEITGGSISQTAYASASGYISDGYVAVDISLLDEYVEGFSYGVYSNAAATVVYNEIFEVLNNKIGNLETELSALKELVGSWTGDEETADEEGTATVIETLLELIEAMGDAQDNISGLQNTVNALQTAVGTLEGYFADGTLNGLAERVEALESNYSTLTTKTISALQTSVSALQSELTAAIAAFDNAEIDSLADAMSELLSQLADINKAIEALDDTYATDSDLSEVIGNLKTELENALKSAQTTLQAAIDNVQANLEAAVAGLEQSIADNASDVATKLAALEEAYKAADIIINGNIAELTAADSTLAASISALETAYEAADEAIWAAIEALQATVGDLQAEVAANTEDIDSLTSQLNSVSAVMWVLFAVVILMLAGGAAGLVIFLIRRRRRL